MRFNGCMLLITSGLLWTTSHRSSIIIKIWTDRVCSLCLLLEGVENGTTFGPTSIGALIKSTFATDKDTSTLRHVTAVSTTAMTTSAINDICICHDRTTTTVMIQPRLSWRHTGGHDSTNAVSWDLESPANGMSTRHAAAANDDIGGRDPAGSGLRLSEWDDVVYCFVSTQLPLSRQWIINWCRWNEVKQKVRPVWSIAFTALCDFWYWAP